MTSGAETDVVDYDGKTETALCTVCKQNIEVVTDGDDIVLADCKRVKVPGSESTLLAHVLCYEQEMRRAENASAVKEPETGKREAREEDLDKLKAMVAGFESARKRARVDA